MNSNFQPGLVGGKTNEFPVLDDDRQKTIWIALGVLFALVLYAYWNNLVRIAPNWKDAQYSHGWLIPIFAACLLYVRKESFRDVPSWHRWVGVGIIVVSVLARGYGAQNTIFFYDNLSMIPCMIGLFVIVGGLPTLRWAGPAIGFLFFMYPLPRLFEEQIMHPLQRIATFLSVLLLRTLGVYAFQEGNTINLAERKMGVVEQCSGLRMLTIFAALSVGVALIMRTRPWWERTMILLSAVPIAIAVNVIRITVIALFYNFIEGDLTDAIFHDVGGLLMMPLALGLLFLETQILSRIVIEEDNQATDAWSLGKT